MSDLYRENANLRRILEVTRYLAVTTDLDVLLGTIVEAACEVLVCERATIFLYDAKTKELYSRVAKGVDAIRFPADRGIAGVAKMERLPAALMVVDVMREKIAVSEARRLGIPVIALVDTNGDPDGIDYPIPGNDDGSRAIELIIKLLGDTILLASNEYAKHAAEESRKRAIVEAEDVG